MPPNQKKQNNTSKKDLVEWGEKAETSNLERGLLSLLFELLTDILDYFPSLLGSYNLFYFCHRRSFRPEIFLVLINMLRIDATSLGVNQRLFYTKGQSRLGIEGVRQRCLPSSSTQMRWSLSQSLLGILHWVSVSVV